MSALSHDHTEKARKFETLLLQRLASVGQRPVADALSVSESTVSRLKEGAISQFSSLLPLLGLKVVPIEMQCYRPEDINPLIHLAKRHMENLNSADQLRWED